MNMKLRKQQIDVIEKCRQAILKGKKRIILYLPTGGGKTVCAMHMAWSATQKKKRVGFGVNRVQLSNQARLAFSKENLDHDVVQAANTVIDGKDIVIFSIDSVKTQGLPDVDWLCLDEAHRTVNREQYHKIMQNKICVGLTATPFARGMGKHVSILNGPLWETIIVGATIKELIEWNKTHPLEGLVPAEVWIPEIHSTKGMGTSRLNGEKDFDANDQAKVLNTESLVKDCVEKWMQIAPNTQTVAFNTTIEHSKAECQAFCSAGISAEHVDYHTKDDKRALFDT